MAISTRGAGLRSAIFLVCGLLLGQLALAAEPVKFPNTRVSEDKIEGATFYTDASSTKFNNVNAIFAYVAAAPGMTPTLRLKVQYEGDKWLFMQKVIIAADDKKFEVTGSWKRDNKARVWEWLDEPMTGPKVAMLKTVSTAKEVTVRYVGKQYHVDRKVPATELKALGNMLTVYAKLGGK